MISEESDTSDQVEIVFFEILSFLWLGDLLTVMRIEILKVNWLRRNLELESWRMILTLNCWML